MPRTELFGALRERQFRLLWLGQATSTLGDGLVPVALAFAVIGTLDRSATALGVVLAAHTLPLVLFVLVGGVWADRLPRQLVMLVSDSIRCAVQATLAVLLLSGAAELWHLVVLIAIYGTAESFFQPAATGLVPATVSPQRLQQANALLGLSRSIAFVLGPAIAGVIAATTNPGHRLRRRRRNVCGERDLAGSPAAAAVPPRRCAQQLPRRPQGRVARARRAHVAVGDRRLGLDVSLHRRRTVSDARPGDREGVARRRGGVGDHRRRLGRRLAGRRFARAALETGAADARLLASSSCAIAPAIALLALRAPAPVIAAAQAIGGIGMGFFGAVWQTTLQQHVPEEALSRVSAWDWMGSFAFLPLGLILAGPVSGCDRDLDDALDLGRLPVVSTLAVLLVPGVRNLRRLDEPEPEPEDVLSALTGEPVEAFHG